MNTKSHFDAVAADYRERSRRGIWGRLRRMESEAFRPFIPSPLGHVLELGSGAGFYTEQILARHPLSVTCVDFSERMLEEIPSSCRKISCDLDALEALAPSSPYDVVCCAGALEFVLRPHHVFKTVSQLLKTDGQFIVLAPRKNSATYIYRWSHRLNGIPIRMFSKRELVDWGNRYELELIGSRPVFPFNIALAFRKLSTRSRVPPPAANVPT